jgi:hypothetical protein
MARAASFFLMCLCLAPSTVLSQERAPATDAPVAGAAPRSIPAPGGARPAHLARDLAEFLKSQGYIEIPLVITKDGFLNVKVQVNGQPLDFVVDTGAGNVVLDTAVARRLDLPVKESRDTLAGVSGSGLISRTVVERLSIGPIESSGETIVADLGPINRERAKFDSPACDGILGNNILQLHGAVIDHSSAKLLLVDPATIFNLDSRMGTRSTRQTSLKDGRVMHKVTVELPYPRPRLVTAACFDALEPGMTARRILERLGGELTEARMTRSFTGTMSVVQGSSRIDLVLKQGNLVSKSAHGLE